MTDINLRILLNASQGNTMSVIGDVTRALGKGGLSGAMDALGIAAVGAGLAIGGLAVDKSAAFQNAMLQNVAHAGLAKNQFDAVSKSVLAMSTDVGQMPTDLAQGLYPILSGFSGITDQGAKAKSSLEALRLAAEDVVGTETKTTVTSGALVSAFNALGLQTNNTATNIAHLKTLNDQMEATVIAGNMHWDQYANVVGKLATAIKGTNVQWTEASAALATMTNEGFTAQRSQTYLANLFTQLDLKTDSLVKNAKKLNIAFDEQKFKSMSLADQLDYLQKITGGNSSEVLKLLNNNATALKTYNALESGMKSYKTNLDGIKNSHGATATAFQTASSGFKASTDRFKAAIDVLLIDLGTQLLPVLSKVLDWVTPLIKRFADWVVNSKDLHTWLNNVGSFLQYTFLPALQNTVGWFQQGGPAVDAVKVGLAGVGIALGTIKTVEVIKGLDNIVTKLGDMKKAFGDFISWFGDTFLSKFQTHAGDAVTAEESIGKSMKTTVATDVAEGATLAETSIDGIGLKAKDTAATVEEQAGFMKGALEGVLGGLGVIGGLILLQKQLDVAGPILTGQANDPGAGPHPTLKHYHGPHSFASGVSNFSGGLAYVHKDEVLSNLAPGTNVTPASRVNMGGTNITINVSTMAGSRAEIIRMVDLIEAELAARFRSTTPNYGFGGGVT